MPLETTPPISSPLTLIPASRCAVKYPAHVNIVTKQKSTNLPLRILYSLNRSRPGWVLDGQYIPESRRLGRLRPDSTATTRYFVGMADGRHLLSSFVSTSPRKRPHIMQCGFSEDLSRGGKVTARGMRHISFGAIGVVAFTAVAFSFVKSHSFGSVLNQPQGELQKFERLRSFEIFPLETVSETSSNASIGDLNGDGFPDIVLVKGRHWQVTSRVFLGDGKGHFAPGAPLPSKATKSYSGSLADMTKSGHLDTRSQSIRQCNKACLIFRRL